MDSLDFLILLAALSGVAAGWFMASRTLRGRIDAARAVSAAQADTVRVTLEERTRGFEERISQLEVAEARLQAEERRVVELTRAGAELQARLGALQQRLTELQDERDRLAGEARALVSADGDKAAHIRGLETRLADAHRHHEENLARLNALVAEADKRLTSHFEALAGRILEEKTARFTETNRARLDELLEPFRERLKEFQKKIEETHLAETSGQRSLRDELERLMKLNQQVSDDARNLTAALKGEAKTQGCWGEMVLERTLEMSGLTRGREYDVQISHRTDDGDRRQPDVIIHLPDDRHLVVDSKVSLVAFERYTSATSDEDRQAALAAHLVSMKNHIRDLGEKNYPQLLGPATLEFTLLFVPVEPAFLAAVQAEPELYHTAWRTKVVLVGPTTLLATLRVVESIWRLDRQNRNALKIAEQGGRVYDAFVLFMRDLDKATRYMHDATAALDSAVHRARTGRGNLVRGFDQLRQLGAKTARELPPGLLEATDDLPPEVAVLPDTETG